MKKINHTTFLFSLVVIATGFNIIFKGNIWDLHLANERYFIGGGLAVFGFYILMLEIKSKIE